MIKKIYKEIDGKKKNIFKKEIIKRNIKIKI